jgi:hypothetical protein
MALTQEADRQQKRLRDPAQTSIDDESQDAKGSLRYRRIRRARQLEAQRRVSIFVVLAVITIPFALFIVKTAKGAFTKPALTTVREQVDVQEPLPRITPTVSIEEEVEDFLRRVHRKESSSGTNTNPRALHIVIGN